MTIPPKSEAAKFERAVELIQDGECAYCCTALTLVVACNSSRLLFEMLFKPSPRCLVWWSWDSEEDCEARKIALLLTAEIIRTQTL